MKPLEPGTPGVLVSIRLTASLAKSVDERARREKRTRSDLLRELVANGIEEKDDLPATRLRRIEREVAAVRRQLRGWKSRR